MDTFPGLHLLATAAVLCIPDAHTCECPKFHITSLFMTIYDQDWH